MHDINAAVRARAPRHRSSSSARCSRPTASSPNDRKQGYYRFLFSKPRGAVALLRAGVPRALGGLRAGARRCSRSCTARSCGPMLTSRCSRRCALMYLCYAGIAFAALRRGALGLALARGVDRRRALRVAALRRLHIARRRLLLPASPAPPHERGLRRRRRAAAPLTVASSLWFAGYGAACYLAALVVLRRSPARRSASSPSPAAITDAASSACPSDLDVALDPATVHRTVLPNGLTVLVRRDTSARWWRSSPT